MKIKFRHIILALIILVMSASVVCAKETIKDLKIVKQPTSVTVSKGSTAKVKIDADGSDLTYAWYYKNKGAEKFRRSATVKKDTYTVKMSKSRAGRKVYCVVKDTNGNKLKSNVATLSMGTTLRVTKQPKAIAVKKGETAKVTIKATGDKLSYYWYYKNKGEKKFSRTSSFKGTSYKAPMNKSRDGRQIYCVIKDKYGSKVQTKTVTLSQIEPVKITAQPKPVRVKNGEELTITVKATGTGLKYKWYYKDYGSSSYKSTDTFTGNTYKATMTSKRYGRKVYCKITDKYGNSVKTNAVTLGMKGAVPDGKPAVKDCPECIDKVSGTTFGYDTVYSQSKKLSKVPKTFEAVFQIEKEDVTANPIQTLDSKVNYSETVLFSNDDTYDICATYSITEDGHPKVGLRHKDWYRRYNNFVFDEVSVFSPRTVHLAITIDQKNDKIKCYVNGRLKQTISKLPKEAKTEFVPTYRYAIGGDLYSGNVNHFRGELYSLSVWSDIRTADEVMNDYAKGTTIKDDKLLASYNLSGCSKCMLKDYSSKGNNIIAEELWLKESEVEPVGEFDYSFVVIGDTQELSEDYPKGFEDLYKWIVDNKTKHKIEYVLGLGDITQKSYDYEWEHAKKSIYQMNDIVPYLLSRGNHDYDTVKDGVVTAGYNKTFNDGVYNKQITGAMIEGDMRNVYRTINICGIDYLFLSLDFGPNAETLKWADAVVSEHPDHRVVVITHGYMYRDGTTLDRYDAYSASRYPIRDRKEEQSKNPSLDGDDMWEQFASKHSNIQLVLSGHDPCQHVVYRQDEGDNGNVVTQMLIDPQHIDGFYTPTGMVAMFYFSNNGNTLTVRYYSVIKDLYGSESSQFTIDLTK